MRIKSNGPTISTREELDATLAEIRNLTINRNQCQLGRDERMTAIDEQFGPALTEFGKSIAERVERVRAWAESNPDAFGKHKSLDTTHAVIGWRTGMPSLKTLTGWTWDRVFDKLKSLPAMARAYIRTKEEVAKENLLADRDTLGPDGLRNLGVKVVQAEPFYVEPKLEEVANKQQS